MFHNRKDNFNINNEKERSLRLIYSDKGSSYEEPLKKDEYIQVLATEMSKIIYHLRISATYFVEQKSFSTI